MTPALLRAYRATLYAVETIPVRVGRRAPGLDGHGPVVLLTAWNPLSRRMPLGWNHRMQLRLRAHLRGRAVREADGALREWREAHLAVRADPRWCAVLARRFRQRAIVVVRPRHPARLVFLAGGCRGSSGMLPWPPSASGLP